MSANSNFAFAVSSYIREPIHFLMLLAKFRLQTFLEFPDQFTGFEASVFQMSGWVCRDSSLLSQKGCGAGSFQMSSGHLGRELAPGAAYLKPCVFCIPAHFLFASWARPGSLIL
jgi:hypothetical protein